MSEGKLKMKLREFYRGKRVLVTGHTGFKGGWLVQILVKMGAEVVGYSLEPNTDPNLFSALNLKNKVKSHIGDIRELDNVAKVMKEEKPEIVFHLAAQALVRDSYDDPVYTFDTNIIGTANILQAVNEAGGVKAVVVITTDKVYEDKGDKAYKEGDELGGYDPYSTSKACAELVTRSFSRSLCNPKDYEEHGTLVATARSGNVIGGGDWSKDRLVPDFVKSIFEQGKDIVLRCPTAVRPWQHVLEPVIGYMMLGARLYEGDNESAGAWNFAPNMANMITVKELTEKAIEISGKGGYSIHEEDKKHETEILKLDATKAKEKLGYKPILEIDETLKWTFEWYKKYYEDKEVEELTNKQIDGMLAKIQ